MKHSLRLLVIVMVAMLVGCGGNKNSYAKVKGTVTLNGKPLDKGEITFSLPGKPPTFMDITDGKFSGQALIGSNTISVSVKKKSGAAPKPLPPQAQAQMKAYREKGIGQGGADPNAASMDSTIELIPSEWNTASKQVRMVEAGSANEFEFNIKTQ
jgi:hypothetical protein